MKQFKIKGFAPEEKFLLNIKGGTNTLHEDFTEVAIGFDTLKKLFHSGIQISVRGVGHKKAGEGFSLFSADTIEGSFGKGSTENPQKVVEKLRKYLGNGKFPDYVLLKSIQEKIELEFLIEYEAIDEVKLILTNIKNETI